MTTPVHDVMLATAKQCDEACHHSSDIAALSGAAATLRMAAAAWPTERRPAMRGARPADVVADVAMVWRDEPEHEGRIYVRNGWPALADALDALVAAAHPQVR